MNPQPTSTGTNGATPAHELFALTDEQILGIEPTSEPTSTRDSLSITPENLEQPPSRAAVAQGRLSGPEAFPNDGQGRSAEEVHQSTVTSSASHQSVVSNHQTEPPPWLAAQMKDPWSGQEATEFWNGVQQARSEAAAYRQAFANPEEARALKEMYPGGVNEARSASDRARLLDEIDHAYFGGAGKPPEEITASRAQLAQRLLREDPAAFREMLAAGLRALDEVNVASPFSAAPSIANALTPAAATENRN